jgi:hypothetical protein
MNKTTFELKIWFYEDEEILAKGDMNIVTKEIMKRVEKGFTSGSGYFGDEYSIYD